jgi:glycerate 2-kinase
MTLRQDADRIIAAALAESMPGEAVHRALADMRLPEGGRVIPVAVGKAAFEMARTAREALGDRMENGIVITKYGHVKGEIKGMTCFEAGHPIPDENGFRATDAVLRRVSGLHAQDTVLFLLSGGGSALFEKPLLPPGEMADITRQLLACGADIVEINTLRKRFSAVKGGKFALSCTPARVCSVILSDIIGDPVDMIASGPACPDPSTCAQAWEIAERYHLKLSDDARALLSIETPKQLQNAETHVTGSVRQLCAAAQRVCGELGYQTMLLTAGLSCEAREAGAFLAAIARDHQDTPCSLAFIAGGETVVHVTGNGLGGRNQELALAAAQGIAGCRDTCVFSVGSDGTDGPTDAAGGYADAHTCGDLAAHGMDIRKYLADNDAYHALQAVNGLIMTGPTGTNVNDLTVVLIKR